MKKLTQTVSLLLASLIAVQVQATDPTNNNLRLHADKPQPGKQINFDYSTATGKLAGKKEVKVALFFYTANNVASYYAIDLDLKLSGKDAWKGSFTVPDSAVAFALRFKSGKEIDDNNGNGYVSLVYTGSAVSNGGYAAAGLLYSQGKYALKLSNKEDTAIYLLEKEFALHPASKASYETAYFTSLVNLKKKDAYPAVDKRVQEILAGSSLTADDYTKVIRLLQLERKRKEADSITTIAATKFPKSDLAVQYDENKFYEIKDIDSLVQYAASFKQKHPVKEPKDAAAQSASFFAASIASKYLEKKEYRIAIKYISQISDQLADYRGYLYNKVAKDLLEQNTQLSLADSLIQAALQGLDHQLANPAKFKDAGSTLSDWKDNINNYYYADFSDTYAKVLERKGKTKQALQTQQKVIDLSKGENNAYNEHYIKYLAATGDVANAKKNAEQYIRAGVATDSIKIWFKDFYVKEKGSDKGYDTYLSGLESSAKLKIREEALKTKIDLPAAGFSVPDLNGNTISLASLKGKVVVVDFWATWCGPCKASFPGMQKAVNKFSADSSVVFLFVDTWESVAAEERSALVKKFIADNNYSFTVLLDKLVDLEKRQYSVVSDYGVEGIPTKFIINPAGRIVFKAVGFDGNDDKLVEELSTFIQIAKE